ncbi:MAG: hypothetical protein AAF744_03185 [Pseudomonadota bacterium]
MQVLQFQTTERVALDQERLGALYRQLGTPGAEDVVCRAMEELALRMSHTERLYSEGDWPALRKNTRSLIAIADQIGMMMLSKVAGDVTECIDAGDPVAVAATLTRLMRIGERSLTAIWDVGEKEF